MAIRTMTDVESFLQQNVLHRSPHTLKAYGRLLVTYAEFLTKRGTSARSCTVLDVAAFFDQLTATRTYAPRSIRRNALQRVLDRL